MPKSFNAEILQDDSFMAFFALFFIRDFYILFILFVGAVIK